MRPVLPAKQHCTTQRRCALLLITHVFAMLCTVCGNVIDDLHLVIGLTWLSTYGRYAILDTDHLENHQPELDLDCAQAGAPPAVTQRLLASCRQREAGSEGGDGVQVLAARRRDGRGRTPLHCAASHGSWPNAALLLQV